MFYNTVPCLHNNEYFSYYLILNIFNKYVLFNITVYIKLIYKIY